MNLEQDYIDLFSQKRKGHMGKYIYMYRPAIYDEIIKQDAYYPFKMESELLIQMANHICENFENVRHVLELGPGSRIPILSKTVPFLKTLKSKIGAFTYTAVDSTLEYAEQACALVEQNIDNIKTNPLEIDFLQPNAFDTARSGDHPHHNRLMICFGQPIFANNDDNDIEILLRSIGRFLNQGDYLLFGVDKNNDEVLLESAYNIKPIQELLLNSMYHLKLTLNLESFDPEAFKLTCKWDNKENKVELSLKATTQQIIKIREQELLIDKGQQFNILNSRRPVIEAIRKFLAQENLIIKNVISLNSDASNTFSIIIAQKHSSL
ncbi:L-histidine N(alpha)-methyltransferase [Candidatus Odyssella thessalonicensis]|uniref:L-histidine N(alpha)-methyltransferase n=1 Tax=Candidatus Odyssella thessalonicensis TaxID=84647 RepID=UPI000225B1FD|nr:L-histidine N(alpha)-methyltransferase [Candidatus Odyssella thessalonicensis]